MSTFDGCKCIHNHVVSAQADMECRRMHRQLGECASAQRTRGKSSAGDEGAWHAKWAGLREGSSCSSHRRSIGSFKARVDDLLHQQTPRRDRTCYARQRAAPPPVAPTARSAGMPWPLSSSMAERKATQAARAHPCAHQWVWHDGVLHGPSK